MAKKSRRVKNPQAPGRRKWVITDEIREKIKQYAACGLTKGEIHTKLGIGHNTFYARLKEEPELYNLIEEGRITSRAAITGKLFEMAQKGNVRAAELYLRFVHRMSERHDVNLGGSNESNPLMIYLSKLTPDEIEERYNQLIKKAKGNT